jgi:hypothetical protein
MEILLLRRIHRFLGRAIILAAQARGHAVTAFNRGHQDPLRGVEHVIGDRNDLAPLGNGAGTSQSTPAARSRGTPAPRPNGSHRWSNTTPSSRR